MTSRLLARRSTVVGFVIVVVLAAVALFASWLAPHDPTLVDPVRAFAGPSAKHWLGTDNLGRDLLSRLIYGARWSLGLVLVATCLIMSAGVAVGVACEGCPPLPDLMKRYEAAGGRYYVCRICFDAKKLDKSKLIAAAEVQGTIPMWQWIGEEGATTFSY